MAAATATETGGPHEEARKRPYVVVFGILAVVTLAELNVYSLGIPHLETITILVVLATIKASLVVAYYMHLRYEPRWIALIPGWTRPRRRARRGTHRDVGPSVMRSRIPRAATAVKGTMGSTGFEPVTFAV